MDEPTIPMHYVATLEQAWQITRQRPHFWASNCGCRQGRGRCSRSRMDVCLIFTEQDPGSGSGKHAITLDEVKEIFNEARTQHLVACPYRDPSRTFIDGICFCCDDCCGYFLEPAEACDKGNLIELTDPAAGNQCGECVDVCYFKARRMEASLMVEREQCYVCGLCVEVCPQECIQMVARAPLPV